MDNALSERIERIRNAVNISSIVDVNSNGVSTCPACGKKGKASVWDDKTLKCWSASCVLNKSRDVITLYRYLKGLEDKVGFWQAIKELEVIGKISVDAVNNLNERSFLLEECLKVYNSFLWGPEGTEALSYLRSRGFYDDTIKRQRIGFAPNGYCLRGFDIDLNALRREGLLKGRKEFYDNRIVFPIRNYSNRLVHFVGRYLGEVPLDESGVEMLPRYKDTPSVKEIKGSKSFLAFEEEIPNYLKSFDYVVLAEGYPDALTLKQRGIPAVGLLGLEKVINHASKIKDFKKCICVFDNDIFSKDHPIHPLEYKSWYRIIPQLIELQMILPHVEFYIWKVPEVSKDSKGRTYESKDINDWFNKSGDYVNYLWDIINKSKKDLVLELIEKKASDISNHLLLLKLIYSTGKDSSMLNKYVPSELSPIDYALQVLGS